MPLELVPSAGEEQLARAPQSAVTDEIRRILMVVGEGCPPGVRISFDFDAPLPRGAARMSTMDIEDRCCQSNRNLSPIDAAVAW
jgi:hypothetical protein